MFLLGLITPMLWRGAIEPKHGPLRACPPVLADLHNLSCLFSVKPQGWAMFYVQGRRDGDPAWTTLDHREVYRLEPFGHRTRMHRYLQAWSRKKGKATREMADHFFVRWDELHPDEPPLDEIRFTWTWHDPKVEEPPQGAWSPPPWEKVPPNKRRVIARHRRSK